MFDSGLSMHHQVNSVVKAAWASLWKIGKIRKYLTEDAAKTLVHASITSRLDYCNSLMAGLPATLTNKLQLVQNAAARVITRTKKFDHITPVLRELHWLPIIYRIQFKVCLIVFKALQKSAPKYVIEMLKPMGQTNTRSTADDIIQLRIPKSRLVNYGDRAFSVIAPKLWNALPGDVRKAESLAIFKSKLKTHFFKLAFPSES